MCLFYKIVNDGTPKFLKNCITFPPPPPESRYGRPQVTIVEHPPVCILPTRTDKFKNSFFPSSILSWNNVLDNSQRSSTNLNIFKKKILGLFKPRKSELYGILDKEGVRRLTQIRVDLNPLKYYKFMHNFLDTNDPMCLLNDGIETREHFFLDCGLHQLSRTTLLNNISLATGCDLAHST